MPAAPAAPMAAASSSKQLGDKCEQEQEDDCVPQSDCSSSNLQDSTAPAALNTPQQSRNMLSKQSGLSGSLSLDAVGAGMRDGSMSPTSPDQALQQQQQQQQQEVLSQLQVQFARTRLGSDADAPASGTPDEQSQAAGVVQAATAAAPAAAARAALYDHQLPADAPPMDADDPAYYAHLHHPPAPELPQMGIEMPAAPAAAPQACALEGLPEYVYLQTCSLDGRGPHDVTFTGFNLLGVGSYDTKVRQGVRCGTMVAVKFLREQQANENDQEYVASLRHEVAVHFRVSSYPGVVKLYAVCKQPPALILEQCVCSLKDAIAWWPALQPQPPQPPQRQLQLLQQQQQQEPSPQVPLPQPEHQEQEAPQQQQPQQPQQQPQLQPVQPLPSWVLVKHLMQQAASALWGLHAAQQPVIHNDVRAMNMLLDYSYDLSQARPTWKLLLCDFGISVNATAYEATAPQDLPKHAVAGQPWGRSRCKVPDPWLAPELMRGDGFEGMRHLVTGATDIYALGCTLEEMLCGRNPMINWYGQKQVPPPEQWLPVFRQEQHPARDLLLRLLQECISSEPGQRPTAMRLRTELTGVR